jgi:hypothetical protein
MLSKKARNTFVEVIGYWLKDARKEHFKVVDVNVFNMEKNVSIDYQKLCGVI